MLVVWCTVDTAVSGRIDESEELCVKALWTGSGKKVLEKCSPFTIYQHSLPPAWPRRIQLSARPTTKTLWPSSVWTTPLWCTWRSSPSSWPWSASCERRISRGKVRKHTVCSALFPPLRRLSLSVSVSSLVVLCVSGWPLCFRLFGCPFFVLSPSLKSCVYLGGLSVFVSILVFLTLQWMSSLCSAS